MGKMSLLFVVFIYAFCGLAQRQLNSENIELQWGPTEEREKHTTHGKFIGYDDTGFYTYRRKKKIDYLTHYDTSLSRDKELALLLPETKLYRRIEEFFFANNKLYLITSETDKNNKQNIIYLQTINKTTLQSNEDKQELARITGDYFKNMSNSYLSTELCPDKSKFLIYFKIPSESDDLTHRKAIVIDTKTNKKLREKELTFNYLEAALDFKDYLIGNDGVLYFLVSETRDRKEAKKDGKDRYLYHVFVNKEGENSIDFEIKLNDLFINNIKIALMNNGDLVAAGFYSKTQNGGDDGSFFGTLNVKAEVFSKVSIKEFSSEFIKENLTHREEKKLNKKESKGEDLSLNNYKLDYLIKREDGGVILVAEQFRLEVVTYYSPACKCFKTYYVYHYDDIIVISINPIGEIEWNEKIPKRQAAQSSEELSYAIGWNNKKIYFVFNDHPANFEPDRDKYSGEITEFTGGKSAVNLTTVNIEKQGYFTQELLWQSGDVQGVTKPKKFAKQLDDDVITMYIQGKKRTQRYVKLKLK